MKLRLSLLLLSMSLWLSCNSCSKKGSGADTVKAPMGMFSEPLIDNDLAAVDSVIRAYYGMTRLDAPERPVQTAQRTEKKVEVTKRETV